MAKKKSYANQDVAGVSNAAQTLLANIRFMSVDNPIHTIVFTSAIPDEGKTFVSANTARAMAMSGKRTLVVEADMRRRSLANALGVHASHGIYSVLAGETPLKQAAIPTKVPRLYFLDSEPRIPNPPDLLVSRRFSLLLDKMASEFDYVVFDTPPVTAFVDAAVLGSKVDAVFMVVREHNTRSSDVVRAAEQLRTANAPLMGIVMNYCKHDSGDYYYDYYYSEKGEKRPAAESSGRLNRDWSNAPDIASDGADGSV